MIDSLMHDLSAKIAGNLEAFGNSYFSEYPEILSLLSLTNSPLNSDPYLAVSKSVTKPYAPIRIDLAVLHFCILKRSVLEVLEFGVGYSTKVMAHALSLNRLRFQNSLQNLRLTDPFTVTSIDNYKKYIRKTRRSTPTFLRDFINFRYSPVTMTTFNGRISTKYKRFPGIFPELVYLDGPSQNHVKGNVNGVTTSNFCAMPMASDLLIYEHFFKPGTLIIVDGRTANTRFLLRNFQRNWEYRYFEPTDQHFFELIESPLGKWNKEHLYFVRSQNNKV